MSENEHNLVEQMKKLGIDCQETFNGINSKLYFAGECVLIITEVTPLIDGTYRLIYIEEDDFRLEIEHGNEVSEILKEGMFELVYDGTEGKVKFENE
ncbi:MAG: hypothetical protein K5790_10325 [Nitrosopumilus sp.]|uniref:hypothetical protein n=1 Tax=Nitrosopumilus sp. TaxID=2024843 RepID=UPI00247B4E29|nr:hypothetical protein [Nitrosopumilus sp.]MCV0393665.1 hypothetical protein [Nitrosopumilus sp.]